MQGTSLFMQPVGKNLHTQIKKNNVKKNLVLRKIHIYWKGQMDFHDIHRLIVVPENPFLHAVHIRTPILILM